jgi:hypothetical protein
MVVRSCGVSDFIWTLRFPTLSFSSQHERSHRYDISGTVFDPTMLHPALAHLGSVTYVD